MGEPAVYERMKDAAARRNRAASASGRALPPPRAPQHPAEAAACERDLRAFCERYHAATFSLAWSPDHLRVISKLQAAILEGAQLAVAMPRASGKTSLIVAATEWALLYGHRHFVVAIGASEAAGVELLRIIRSDLSTDGTLLVADFPEVCDPIVALDGIANRCAGQTDHKGRRTNIKWTDNELVLPTIEGSVASGAIVRVAGLTGRLRGMLARLPDGSTARPDLVLVDDPQTDDSARSLTQCAARERLLAGAVLGLAGPGKRIAALAAVTVIRPGDVADNILDRTLHPEWNGERTKLLYEFPTETKLWEQYAEARAESLRTHGDIRDATAFYAANREAMDRGALVAWPERKRDDELSALQHAMNLRLQDEAAFQAEYQNDPIEPRDSVDDVGILSADEIARRLNGREQGIVPAMATRLTAFVDVQQRLLYWMVVAWANDFTGWVVDYGTLPEQTRERFTYADAERTLESIHKGVGLEDQLFAGLVALTDRLCSAHWTREGDGAPMTVDRCMVDANWNVSTETVKHVCQRSTHAQALLCSYGRFFGLSAKPLAEWKRDRKDRSGYGWRIEAAHPREIRFDSGLWKSFVHSRLATAAGDPGSLTLWGKKPARHRMLAEHLTSEARERLRGNGRTIDVWTLIKRRDNHLLDCLVGCAVGASERGVALRSMEPAQAAKRKVVRLSELQGRKRA